MQLLERLDSKFLGGERSTFESPERNMNGSSVGLVSVNDMHKLEEAGCLFPPKLFRHPIATNRIENDFATRKSNKRAIFCLGKKKAGGGGEERKNG